MLRPHAIDWSCIHVLRGVRSLGLAIELRVQHVVEPLLGGSVLTNLNKIVVNLSGRGGVGRSDTFVLSSVRATSQASKEFSDGLIGVYAEAENLPGKKYWWDLVQVRHYSNPAYID